MYLRRISWCFADSLEKWRKRKRRASPCYLDTPKYMHDTQDHQDQQCVTHDYFCSNHDLGIWIWKPFDVCTLTERAYANKKEMKIMKMKEAQKARFCPQWRQQVRDSRRVMSIILVLGLRVRYKFDVGRHPHVHLGCWSCSCKSQSSSIQSKAAPMQQCCLQGKLRPQFRRKNIKLPLHPIWIVLRRQIVPRLASFDIWIQIPVIHLLQPTETSTDSGLICKCNYHILCSTVAPELAWKHSVFVENSELWDLQLRSLLNFLCTSRSFGSNAHNAYCCTTEVFIEDLSTVVSQEALPGQGNIGNIRIITNR